MAKHLEDLMSRGEFDLAASECPNLLVGDAMAWERWIYGFARRRRLSAVVPFVPTTEPRLPPSVYEVVLEHLMLTEPQLFLETLRRCGTVGDTIICLMSHAVLGDGQPGRGVCVRSGGAAVAFAKQSAA